MDGNLNPGLLLIAHGSRHADANEDLNRLAEGLRLLGVYPIIEPAFLELAEPNIDEAARRCVQRGADRVILVPYFLSAGLHVQRDLKAAQERMAGLYPSVRFFLAKPLGPDSRLVGIVLDRVAEATRDSNPSK
jgi:sirohydrochlorin ferrochelatase